MSQISGLVYRPLGPDPLAVNINQSDRTTGDVAVTIDQSGKTAGGIAVNIDNSDRQGLVFSGQPIVGGGDTFETAANDAFSGLMNASPIVPSMPQAPGDKDSVPLGVLVLNPARSDHRG